MSLKLFTHADETFQRYVEGIIFILGMEESILLSDAPKRFSILVPIAASSSGC